MPPRERKKRLQMNGNKRTRKAVEYISREILREILQCKGRGNDGSKERNMRVAEMRQQIVRSLTVGLLH